MTVQQCPIDILAVFDTAGIAEQYPTPSLDPGAPTVISPALIAIVAAPAPAKGSAFQKANNLVLTGSVGENVRWRALSLTVQAEDTVFFYGISPAKGETKRLPGPMQADYVAINALPNAASSDKPQIMDLPAAYWHHRIVDASKTSCCISFGILNRDGTLKGCYAWLADIAMTGKSIPSPPDAGSTAA